MYGLLNDNLRDKITVYLNGRILHNMQVFDSFQIEFLAKVTFIFKRHSYALDDTVFNVRPSLLIN